MNGVADRVLNGTAWLSLARAIVNVLSILSTIVLARLLAPVRGSLDRLGVPALGRVERVSV